MPRARIEETIATRIDTALLARGKTWPDLGRYMGLTRAGMKKWRDGATPTADNLLTASDWLEVSYRWLLLGKGPMGIPDPVRDDEKELVGAYRKLSPEARDGVLRHTAALLYQETASTGPDKPFRSSPRSS